MTGIEVLVPTIAILAVGIALAGLIWQGQREIREDARNMREQLLEVFQRVSWIEGASGMARGRDLGRPKSGIEESDLYPGRPKSEPDDTTPPEPPG